MHRCLELAGRAAAGGETAVGWRYLFILGPAFGAVVVRGESVIGEGAESSRRLVDPSAHAEVMALRAACQHEGSLDLSGCDLYTTVEPCVLCSLAIRRTGIVRVIYGTPAGQVGGATSNYRLLSDGELTGYPAPPEVVSGILAQECLEILQRRVR